MKKVTIDNCLAAKFPKVAVEWHPTKNGKITPKDVLGGSDYKYWFLCKNGHEWESSLNNRIRSNGCPHCANRKVCDNNCLATKFPEVADEWHPTKNGKLTPRDVIAGSRYKHWFLCKNGHEWEAALASRTCSKRKCPYCTNRKVCDSNCLQNVSPEIAMEWHPTKNGNLTPRDVIASSNKKYWFQCKKGHEWKSILSKRIRNGCPYCGNKKLSFDNCLQNAFPEIAMEWHFVKNGDLTPRDVIAGSNKKYWFQCKKGHEWKVRLNHRTNDKSGCPICLGSKGEKFTAMVLEKLGFRYKRQHRFRSCKNIRTLPFDFLVKTKNGIKTIEYQGKQHYVLVNFGTTELNAKNNFEKIKKNDIIKMNWCQEMEIPLLIIPYWKFNEIEEMVKEFVNN